MKLYNKEEAVRYMNQLGLAGQPFLFAVDYKQETVWLAENGQASLGDIFFSVYSGVAGDTFRV